MKNVSRSTTQDSIGPVRLDALSAAAESSAFNSSLTSSTFAPKPSDKRSANLERPSQSLRGMSIACEENHNSLAADLEDMFDEAFRNAGVIADNAFQESLAAFHHKVNNEPASTMDSLLGFSAGDRQRRTISYEKLLYTMTLELVEMLSIRFGNLGCYQLGDSTARFYAVSLANDDTPTMFESTAAQEADPLVDFDAHRSTQLIEVWFSVHPLSNIMSKTMFLRNYKSNNHDPALLAVMLADASYVHENDATGSKKEALFRWTAMQLRDRPAQNCGLSTVQVLMLLGWHELCLSRARRATCYLGYAGRIVTRLQKNVIQAPETGRSQINGVDVAEVEAELVRNIYWLTFSITLWSFMQIDQPYPQLLPSTVPTEFPPVDESSSAVVKLDIVSDNVSTLAKQSRMIQELWPLSHIASTTAHIYALLPREQEPDEASQSVSWQARPLHQLRRLLSLNQDISSLCTNVRKVLVNAVKVLEVKVENALSKALVLTAYHTTIIHLLFPRLDSADERVYVSEELLEDFCTSSRSLLELFSVADAEHDGSNLITRMRSSTFADVFVLGLDVCGRAIEYFHIRSQEASELERKNISKKAVDIELISSQLHKISKSETLLTAKNLRPVKKKLKEVKLRFSHADALYDTEPPSSINSDIGIFPDSGGSTLKPMPTPTTSAPLFQAIQGIPELQLDVPIQGLFPQEFSAPLPEGWPKASSLDFGSGPSDISSRDNQIDWTREQGIQKYNNEYNDAGLALHGNLHDDPGSLALLSGGPSGHINLAGFQQEYHQIASAPGQSEFRASEIAAGSMVPRLSIPEVGMGIDLFDLGVLDGAEGWPPGTKS
ncbi:hypothetical protein EPUS_00494 [Endocarpon pusillum Z07020]|uniref:Xylanolytic transcriptional activator regulatory domain-containing protein n=1 Tax=Endocarpon pusillum (strain Z07020 / HMAS-L-300199) TaxID=1263415 RepID=U1HMG6_ENDPU|nr:uncharacterized protein EPUS_00494 [Endocarpon pusillum Z07020]ERF71505.1 hypothetical protein EPUS_00494 [Endocarpon pusillum Z07020]